MTQPIDLSGESDDRFMPQVREGQIVAGKYRVGRLLGLGGMGAVHSAVDTLLDRRVALKVLLPRLVASRTASERFLREARAATRITSEHVVRLLEIDTLTDGSPLLVMEHLEGQDLRGVLRDHGPIPVERAVDYLLQALQAIAEGHTHGIVHRDVKPSNLFLTTRADGSPLIKVLDFGIAKTISERPDDFALTNSEDIQLGSPTYMPPEQFQNPRDVDERADIWALGVTLYELVAGRAPFLGRSYLELVSQVLTAAPEPLATADGTPVPDGFEAVIGRCLEKKREQRFPNASALAAALAPFGTEDARLSLARVTGLSRPRPSSGSMNVTRDVSGLEATVPLNALLGLASKRGETSGSRPVSTRPRRLGPGRKLGFAMAAAAAVAVGGLAYKRTSGNSSVDVSGSGSPRAAPSALAHELPAATSPAVSVGEAVVTAPEGGALAASRPVERVPQAASRLAARAPKSALGSAGATFALNAAATRTAVASSESSPNVADGGDRALLPAVSASPSSAEPPPIEALIRKRH